jgi:CubicO group peptidase (beta-lactamase class C family)
MRQQPRSLVAIVLALGGIRTQEPARGEGDHLIARIEAIRAEAGVPALGAALVTVDGLQGTWVAGTRRAGGEERVTADDLWHLGSCTKSMTATLIALLVARGDLAWDTPLPELLPDVAEHMHLDYLDVTLVELLGHRAGVPNTWGPALLAELERSSELPPVEQRAGVVRVMLASAPVHAPREKFLYSNFGFVVAGHVAEVATGKPWEELMQELLFRPLGMESAGFGPPGTPTTNGRCDQPRGHTDAGEPVEPGPDADNPLWLGPAGTVHASLADWAKYVQLHLKGERGDVKVGEITLTRETFALLHRPYDGPEPRYACGWVVESRDWAGGDGTALWHNGSNTMWYCVTWLGPANGVAALVTANQATPKAKGATDQVATLLIQEHQRAAKGAGNR